MRGIAVDGLVQPLDAISTARGRSQTRRCSPDCHGTGLEGRCVVAGDLKVTRSGTLRPRRVSEVFQNCCKMSPFQHRGSVRIWWFARSSKSYPGVRPVTCSPKIRENRPSMPSNPWFKLNCRPVHRQKIGKIGEGGGVYVRELVSLVRRQ
jgi:hypothetical protein